MKDLFNFSLLDLLPPNFTKDPKIRSLCIAIDEELKKLSNATQEVLHLPRIDELPESVLDLLAWQWHVDFYEPIGMDLTTKRQLIKKSISEHRIKGTPAAVENLFSNVFNGGKIQEWFEYGGKPFHFKITALGKQIASEDQLAEFKHALESTKNVRSWLDGFDVSITELFQWYLGAVLSDLVSIKYRPMAENQQSNGLITAGFADISSKYIEKSLETVHKLPKLAVNQGFTDRQYKTIVFPANADDEFMHDLRATALLDLLLVGLGIVREGSTNPISEWTFRNFSTHFSIYLDRLQLTRINLPNSTKYSNFENITTDFIRSTTLSRNFSNDIKETYTAENQLILTSFNSIISKFRNLSDDLDPLAAIKYRKSMNLVADIIANEFKEVKSSILIPEFNKSTSFNFSAVISKNILQKLIMRDIIPKDETIVFNKILSIVEGINSFFSNLDFH